MRAGDGEGVVSCATMRGNGKMPVRANGRYLDVALRSLPAKRGITFRAANTSSSRATGDNMFNFGSGFPQMKFPQMPQMGQGLQAGQGPQMQPMGQGMQLGMPQMPGMPNMQFPLNPGMGQPQAPHMQQQMPFGPDGLPQGGLLSGLQDGAGRYRGAMMDWRGQRPDHMSGMENGDFRQQMMDWRGQRPNRGNGMLPTFNG
jgi:hypothetical protein